MASNFTAGKFQAEKAGGVVPGAKLYTYAAGTTTPLATYTDQGGLSSNANPVVCDANGQASVWLGSSAYRMILKDASDVLIWDVDNVVSVTDSTQIGFSTSAAYTAGTVGQAVQDGLVNVLWFMTDAQRAQVKANGVTLDLTPALAAAQTFAGNRPLYFPAGTYSFTTLSFIGKLGGIVGDGIGITVLKVRSTVTTAIDLNETVDTNPNAGTFKGFTLDGNSLATNGLNVRYRHQISLEDLYVINCTNGFQEKDTYLSRHKNVRARVCTTGMWLVGSNHASTFTGCTFDGNSGTQLLVQSAGTAADGNDALAFTGCDFEFGTGSGTGIDWNGTSGTFTGCYIGENIPGAVIVCRGGTMMITGGVIFFGNTGASYLVQPLGGRVLVKGTVINGQASGSASIITGGSTGGKFKFENVQFAAPVSGSPVIAGDVLDYGPPATTFVPRLGKNWTGEGNNITFSSTVSGNKQTFTVLTAPGPTPLLGAKATLASPSTWRDGETLYLVLVYESSKTVNVSLSGSAFGGVPLKSIQATIPATTGTPNTAIGFQQTADSAAYVLLEAIQTSSAVGDTLVIYECFLADSRMLNKGAGQFGNLYKC